MKSPERTVFEAILFIAVLLALLAFPFVAHGDCAAVKGPPTVADMDSNGDGVVSEEEFDACRSQRQQAMAAQGKPMKGMANAPTFQQVDSNGDGKISQQELTAAQQAHRQAMKQAHSGKGQGEQHGAHGMHGDMKPPTFQDLDLNGDGCIDPDEFAKHQAEMHGAQ